MANPRPYVCFDSTSANPLINIQCRCEMFKRGSAFASQGGRLALQRASACFTISVPGGHIVPRASHRAGSLAPELATAYPRINLLTALGPQGGLFAAHLILAVAMATILSWE